MLLVPNLVRIIRKIPPPTFKNTALDASYNCGGIQRTICISEAKVYDIVDSVLPLPTQQDIIVVLVNDSAFGGSGGPVAVSSTHPEMSEIVLHELGHTFGLLADEYGSGLNNPFCDSSVEPEQANATRATVWSMIKWNAWIDAETEIPTQSTAPGLPGLYEGAKYCDMGLYRPTYESKMNLLFRPFEQINTEQLIKRFYNKVSPIDASSPATEVIEVTQGQTVSFSIETLQTTTQSVNTSWSVDSQSPENGTSYLLDTSSLTLGDHTVVGTARDSTLAVRLDPQHDLREEISWPLRVLPSPCDVNQDGATAAPDIQLIVNQVLGKLPATSDPNQDNSVDIIDVMIVVNAVLGLGCPL